MIDDFFTLLTDIFLWLPRFIWSLTADLIEFFFGFLPTDPIPVQTALNGVTGDVLYFLTIFQVPEGITMVFTALIARFFLRRIPVIG